MTCPQTNDGTKLVSWERNFLENVWPGAKVLGARWSIHFSSGDLQHSLTAEMREERREGEGEGEGVSLSLYDSGVLFRTTWWFGACTLRDR